MRSRTLSATPRDTGVMLDRIDRIFKIYRILILDQTAFTFSAPDRTPENPKREGKQHDQKSEQYNQRLCDLCETVALNQHLSDPVQPMSCGKNKGDASEL